MLEEESNNIMEKIDVKDYAKIRKMMLDNILYTDMTKHG